jgi:hypothetical protein
MHTWGRNFRLGWEAGEAKSPNAYPLHLGSMTGSVLFAHHLMSSLLCNAKPFVRERFRRLVLVRAVDTL